MAKWVLDAGHGGSDKGVINNKGVIESEFVLKAVMEAKRLLEKNSEKVLLTRSENKDLDIYRRVEIANEWNGDYFISFHMNSDLDATVEGTELFVLNLGSQSEKLAKMIKSELVSVMKSKDRGIKEANYYLLRATKMPSVIVEADYLSNVKFTNRLDYKLYGYLVAKACLALVDKVILDLPPKIELKSDKGWTIGIGYYDDFEEARLVLEELKSLGRKDACLIPYKK